MKTQLANLLNVALWTVTIWAASKLMPDEWIEASLSHFVVAVLCMLCVGYLSYKLGKFSKTNSIHKNEI